ncbi:MAG TPA: hypothetical protein VF787_28880 [Thermoanaerobaculia bacterium]
MNDDAQIEVDGPESSRGGWRTSLLIALCCFVVYNANLRSISAGDTYPARYLPFAILQYHTVFLDPLESVVAQGRGAGAFWMLHRPDGHKFSLYPVVTPVLVTPLYVPAIAYLHARGWTNGRLDYVARVMEKLSASFVTALSAALLYLLLRRRAKSSIALLLTIAYAFGTNAWVVSSQALWQHGVASLLLIGALLCLTAPYSTRRAFLASVLLGLLAGNRPPDVVLAAVLGLYALHWAGWKRAALLAAGAVPPILAVLFYNLHTAGLVAGGYGVIGRARFFSHDLLTGLAGLLISPSRGLFVLSPFLLFLVLAWRRLPRSRDERLLTLAMTAGVAIQILLYAKSDWRGGMSWGSRYMADLMPMLIWMLVPVVASLRSLGRAIFLAAVVVSVAFEAIGAFMYAGSVDLPLYTRDREGHHDMRAAFHWQNAPFVTSWRNGFVPPELTIEPRGNIDALESAGRKVTATGWALAGSATPWQIALTVDGVAGGSTATFTARPDIRDALGVASPSGWRIEFDTTGLAPGEHLVTLMAWSSAKGEGHYVAESKLTVHGTSTPASSDTDLERSFNVAVARIREHQNVEGYWLTAHTKQPQFRDPQPEMNTFLTAHLVGLLDPVAAKSGLEESVQRARRHLTSQIESGGLVRYHGLPNGPGIGTLGCAITPDTDDTALVWRLAPDKDRSRLPAALATIERYRTPEGLYRSWLAPREEYQCLDPGRDPNPADIVIQMHLLLLLSEVRPEAGRALCAALQPVVDDDRVWVYYRNAPLIPILRLPDLQRAGCELKLPESRMRTDASDQQIWTTVAHLIGRGDRVLTRAVLRELARDDFALIRTNPPLLYHNDLTATVSRYYWSEDVGYALWLRLYDNYEHPHDPRSLG